MKISAYSFYVFIQIILKLFILKNSFLITKICLCGIHCMVHLKIIKSLLKNVETLLCNSDPQLSVHAYIPMPSKIIVVKIR